MNKWIYTFLLYNIIILCMTQTVPPTNENRSQSVKTYCSGIDRRTLLSEEQYTQYLDLHNSLISYFNIQSNQPFQDIFDQKPISQSQSFDANSAITIYYAPYIVGFLVTFISVIVLIAILICNYQVISYCSRQADYSQCERLWPTLIVIIFILAALGLSAYGLSMKDSFIQPYEKARCAGALFVDDLINGNVTNDGNHYFVGLYVLRSFMPQIQSADFYFNYLSLIIQSTINEQQLLLSDSQQKTRIIPNNNGSVMQLQYNVPLHSDIIEGTVPSTLNQIIGSEIMENTLINKTIQNLQYVKDNLTDLGQQIQRFQDNIAKSRDYLLNAGTQITKIMKNFTSLDKSLQQTFTDQQSYPYGMQSATVALFSLTISSCVIMIVFLIGFECCYSYRFKYFIGFIVLLLTLTSLLCFILAIIYGMGVPVAVSGCQFSKWSLQSPENFRQAYSNFLNSTQLQRMSRCVPGSDGDIISEMVGTYVLQSLSAFSTIVNDIQTFVNVKPDQLVKPTFEKIGFYLDNTINSSYIDIDNQTALDSLRDISNSSKYPNCNSNLFQGDSWVPSLNQSTFKCLNQNDNFSTFQMCNDQVSFINATYNCIGCMDTASFANQYNSSTTQQIKTLFSERYNQQANCSIFNTEMSNIWTNYYIQKYNYLLPVKVRYTDANDSINTAILSIDSQLYNIFNQFIFFIQFIPINPVGFSEGVNCTVLGQDLVLFTRYLCSSILKPLYLHSIIVGTLSFILSFSLCCIVCSYTRYYKVVDQIRVQQIKEIQVDNENQQKLHQDETEGDKKEQMIKNWKQRKQRKQRINKKQMSKVNLAEEEDDFDNV